MRKIIPLILSLFMILMLTACSGNSNEPSIGENTQTSSSGQTNRPDSSTNKSDSNTGSLQSSSLNNSISVSSDASTKPASSSGNSVSSSNSSTEPASTPGSSVSSSNSSTKPVSSDSTSSVQSSSSANSTSKTPSNTSSAEPKPEDTSKKVLVAYFSATGTTKALAEYAADAVNGDLYEIVPKEPYSTADLDYGDRSSRSSKEMDDPSCRPAINGTVSDMSQYDIVFIGYPIWWGEAPRIVSTFIESYDFSGKTIVPFCTSGGSGMGSSARNLHSLTSKSAKWLDGTRLSGSSSRGDMVSWINGLGLDIKAE